MKFFIYFLVVLLFTFSAFAQKDIIIIEKRSVIALDKVNIIYRGIINPISIAVSNCKSFSVSGFGVNKDENGNFSISPGSGLETKITVTIINNDDSVSIEEHFFRIKNLPKPLGLINGQNCSKCLVKLTREELKNAVITIDIKDFLFPFEYKVKSFNLIFSDEKGFKFSGNELNEIVYSKINELKKGSIFSIGGIEISTTSNSYISVSPIKIMITD